MQLKKRKKPIRRIVIIISIVFVLVVVAAVFAASKLGGDTEVMNDIDRHFKALEKIGPEPVNAPEQVSKTAVEKEGTFGLARDRRSRAADKKGSKKGAREKGKKRARKYEDTKARKQEQLCSFQQLHLESREYKPIICMSNTFIGAPFRAFVIIS